MKKQSIILILICFVTVAKADYWTQKATFGGGGRWEAVGFSIGTKGYIGTGQSPPAVNHDDFWEWDQLTNVWTQKSNVPPVARIRAIGFSIGTKGYIATGGNPAIGPFSDCWEWDQATNIWTQKANASANIWAVGFSIGTKGYMANGDYLGMGFWEYDPVTDVWTQKANVAARKYGAGFSIGSKGYIGTGHSPSNSMLNDFWEWDQATNIWTQKANFGGIARAETTGFSIGNYGYIGLGTTQIGSGTVSDFWKYNPSTNTWTQAANYGGGIMEFAVGFSIGCKGYIGTGYINDDNINAPNEFWEYTPDTCSLTGLNEVEEENSKVEILPNPFSEKLNITVNNKEISQIIIYNLNSKKVFYQSFKNSTSINTEQLARGIYLYEVRNKNGVIKKGKIVKD